MTRFARGLKSVPAFATDSATTPANAIMPIPPPIRHSASRLVNGLLSACISVHPRLIHEQKLIRAKQHLHKAAPSGRGKRLLLLRFLLLVIIRRVFLRRLRLLL